MSSRDRLKVWTRSRDRLQDLTASRVRAVRSDRERSDVAAFVLLTIALIAFCLGFSAVHWASYQLNISDYDTESNIPVIGFWDSCICRSPAGKLQPQCTAINVYVSLPTLILADPDYEWFVPLQMTHGLSLASIVATMFSSIGLTLCKRTQLFQNLTCGFYVTSALALLITVTMFGISYKKLVYKPFADITPPGRYTLGWAFYLTVAACVCMFFSAVINLHNTVQRQKEHWHRRAIEDSIRIEEQTREAIRRESAERKRSSGRADMNASRERAHAGD